MKNPLFEVYVTEKRINVLPQEFSVKKDVPPEDICALVTHHLIVALQKALPDTRK